MPLFRSTTLLRKNNVLASNLLFVTLALSVAEQLLGIIYYYWDQAVYTESDPFAKNRVIWLLLETLVKAAFYLAIRRGMLRAKVVVVLVCAYLAYAGTHLQQGYVAGFYFNDPWGYSLLVLLKNLLTLAALVLMFKKASAGFKRPLTPNASA